MTKAVSEDRFDIDPAPLPVVRRLEAAGFRDWPAAASHYDGAWLIRMTASHPAKRLNSVNPLDPADCHNLAPRIEKVRRHFAAYGRPSTFRITPLSSPAIPEELDRLGWERFGESHVMHLNLEFADFGDFIDHLPVKDIGRFVDASMRVHGHAPSMRPGLTEVISSIQAQKGFFIIEEGGKPVASALVVHEADLAGVFDLGVAESARGKGHARAALGAALKWVRGRGARRAWLQVEKDNVAGNALYGSFGFRRVYDYHYMREPVA